MATISMQKQSARYLVLSPNQQAAYGGVLADAALTIQQRFDMSTVFEKDPTLRSDKETVGKGTEFATNSTITAWDTKGTLKDELDAWLAGWMLALTFGQEVVTGAGPLYTHTFTIPPIVATMPGTTLYCVETQAVQFKMPDMAAKMLSLDIPERGAIMASLDMVGTGRWIPGPMLAAIPALQAVNYLLGSDFTVSATPTAAGSTVVPFSGRQKSLSIKVDRGSAPYKASGDGLFASSVESGVTKFSMDMQVAALATDDVNGWFENRIPLSITCATNPNNTYQMGFTFPSAQVKANKLGNNENKVMWQLSFDETSCLQVGMQAAISAFVINNCPAYLIPA